MAADPSRVAQPLVKSFVVMWADGKFVRVRLTASRDGGGPCIPYHDFARDHRQRYTVRKLIANTQLQKTRNIFMPTSESKQAEIAPNSYSHCI
jgi:hypothetical protein